MSGHGLGIRAREHVEIDRLRAEQQVLRLDIPMTPAEVVHGDQRGRKPARNSRDDGR